KAYGPKKVLTEASVAVRRGERVGVIGANGLGKSTLLKILVERLKPDAGTVTWGYQASVGYFAQDHHDLLDDETGTVLDYLWSIIPQEPTSFVRGQLGRMLFSGEDVDKKIKALSGGEAARLIFSRLIVQKPNVLVLDEPTNHLDMESIEALVEALKGYPGTLIFVSHDRWFVSELATRIIEVTADGLTDYPGSYDDYLARQGEDHLDAEAAAAKAKATRMADKADDGDKAASGDFEAHKKRRAAQKKALKRRDEVTAAIDAAETELAAIEEQYCAPGFFEKTSPSEIEALEAKKTTLKAEADRLVEEWEALELELEALAD
ncbi:MAG: ATP-binding cassette domain-containing protein, partial [Myxococcales bacterium]|nr:ATP-binding cassette domain-containing protein [Myxococcales bacterium]